MAEGYKAWNAGDVLNAADLNDYASSQAVMRFANAAGRDAALTSLVVKEGMVAYLKDSNILTVNTDGTTGGWREVSPAEAASIKDSAVTSAKIQDGAVTEVKIADSSVTSAKIANGTIVNADISASAAIDLTKIATPAWTSFTNNIVQGGGGLTQTDYYFKIGRLVIVRVLTSAIPTAGRTAIQITGTLPVTPASSTNTVIGSGSWYSGTGYITGLVAVQRTSTTVAFFTTTEDTLGYFSPTPATGDSLSYTITYEATS